MNRRTFLGLIPAALTIPNEGLRAAAASFVKACESKPEILKKKVLNVDFTAHDFSRVSYSDGSYELIAPEEIDRWSRKHLSGR